MIIVEIQDEADGRVSFEVGPFDNNIEANEWRDKFVVDSEMDGDFVEVRDIEPKIYDPKIASDMDVIYDFYSIER